MHATLYSSNLVSIPTIPEKVHLGFTPLGWAETVFLIVAGA